MDITMETDIVELEQKLNHLAREQVPFASALALTRLAVGGKEEAQETLAQSLKIRAKWTIRGIQSVKADKRQYPKQYSVIGIAEDRAFLVDHVFGTLREPKRGRRIAIPSSRNIKRTTTGKVTKGMRVGKLSKKKGKRGTYFTKAANGKAVLVQRPPTREGKPIRLYNFQPTVKIPKRYNFHDPVARYFTRNYHREFGKALGYALKTAR